MTHGKKKKGLGGKGLPSPPKDRMVKRPVVNKSSNFGERKTPMDLVNKYSEE